MTTVTTHGREAPAQGWTERTLSEILSQPCGCEEEGKGRGGGIIEPVPESLGQNELSG